MVFLEKDLEDYIWIRSKTKIGRQQLKDAGLNPIYGRLYRQINVGEYGILDLVSVHGPSVNQHPITGDIENLCLIKVYELKRGLITSKAIAQLCRYMDALLESHLSEILFNNIVDDYNILITGCAIGSGFTHEAYYQVVCNEGLNIFTYKRDSEGHVKFRHFEDDWTPKDLSYSTINKLSHD